MKKFLILIIILMSSSVFADVYLKSVFTKDTTTRSRVIPIRDQCPSDNDSWDTKFRKCVCDEGFKDSPIGCISDSCDGHSCGNGGKCESTLVVGRYVPGTPRTYHYESSCTCPENYVEFNLECILNPCLDYDCHEYGYCEAVEDQCECKQGYLEYSGDIYKNGERILAEDYKTCIHSNKTWNIISGDRECDLGDGLLRYTYYGSTIVPEELRCLNGIETCKCIRSPFSDNDNPATSFLSKEVDGYTKDNGWVILYRQMGLPQYISNSETSQAIGPIDIPRLIMYNRYTGKMHVFLYLRDLTGTYSYGMLKVGHDMREYYYNQTVLFSHAYSKIFANFDYGSDSYGNVVDFVGNYSISSIVPDLPALDGSEFWYYAEYSTYYDLNTSNIYDSKIKIDLLGVSKTYSEGNIIGKIKERVNLGRVSNENSLFSNLTDVSKLISTFKTAKSYYSSAKSFAESSIIKQGWDTHKKIIINSESMLTGGIKSLIDSVNTSDFSNLKNLMSYTGAAFALIDLFIGTPNTQRSPAIFDANLKLKITSKDEGTIDTFEIKTPGTKELNVINNSLSQPLYDKPLGTFILSSLPYLYKSDIDDKVYVETFPTVRMNVSSYKLNIPSYTVNPDSGLEVDRVFISLQNKIHLNDDEILNKNWHNLKLYEKEDLMLLNVESVRDEETGDIVDRIATYGTKNIPYDMAKNLSITVLQNTEVSIKVIAILKTKNTESDSVKSFIHTSTYVPKVVDVSNSPNNSYYHNNYSKNIFQKELTPIGNLTVKNLENRASFRKGDIIEVSYDRSKSYYDEEDNLFPQNILGLFVYRESGIYSPSDNTVDLIPLDGNIMDWETYSEIKTYFIYEDIGADDCNSYYQNDECLLKQFLEDNAKDNSKTYRVKRKFKIPEDIASGTYSINFDFDYRKYEESDVFYINGNKGVRHNYEDRTFSTSRLITIY